MGKKGLLLMTAFLIFILGGCAGSSGASAGKIIPPPDGNCPLEGKWTVLQELDTNSNTEETTQQWVGSNVQFAADAAAFGGNAWDNLSYKIKRVDTTDYLLSKYISPSDFTAAKTQAVDVITVYAAENYLGEFMKIDETSMIFFVHNKDLLLKKISDQADSMLGTSNTNGQNLNQYAKEGNSGVLLGLRVPSGIGYIYRTLWIAADHQQLHPIMEAEQLFFPRTSGFWELKVQDLSIGGKTGNILTARNVEAKTLKAGKEGDKAYAEGGANVNDVFQPAVRMINYIGNDYVAIEKNSDGVNQLQMLPIDKLSSPTEIKVSDLLGEKGFNAYLNAREQSAAVLREKEEISIEGDESGENFGLKRKNGHWLLVGRINYQNNGAAEQTDFELKTIPPVNLIAYDTLALSWHNIKDRVPDAMDAFTSPNKDIALVRTKNKLTIYTIGNEQLAENPLAELELREGETVIMAEWAIGSYVDSWEKSFISYGAQTLSSSSVRMR